MSWLRKIPKISQIFHEESGRQSKWKEEILQRTNICGAWISLRNVCLTIRRCLNIEIWLFLELEFLRSRSFKSAQESWLTSEANKKRLTIIASKCCFCGSWELGIFGGIFFYRAQRRIWNVNYVPIITYMNINVLQL